MENLWKLLKFQGVLPPPKKSKTADTFDTVDGSEIRQTTTFWMLIKPL